MPERPRRPHKIPPDGDARVFSFALERDENDRLCLRASHRPQYGTIHADWLSPDLDRRIAGGKHQPLARALGLHKQTKLRILDATGGLGRDAWTLAALGATVVLIERHPMIFQLLEDAHSRAVAAQVEAANRIALIHADTLDWFKSDHERAYDAICLDPMYPDDRKTALPSKEMQILRELTGGDTDADTLLHAARTTGKRVVVKRPHHAPPLADAQPDAAIQSTQLRFDLYLPQ